MDSNGFVSNGEVSVVMDSNGFDSNGMVDGVRDSIDIDDLTEVNKSSFSNQDEMLLENDYLLPMRPNGENTSKASTSSYVPNGVEDTPLSEEIFHSFTKSVAALFFKEYGLLSHQFDSYNEFINTGIQGLFDSLGETVVQPGYDPSKKGDGEWKFASVTYGKVTLEPPMYWVGEVNKVDSKEYLKMLPRHARLQNVTYSARLKVEMTVQVK
ncbi:hypothetical protein GIB67_039155 [Kingdonia uniflora]|uniref:DNA-directed RNA polymerase n=1 Tax=Kingdonia uniflora TaxID=39325 RepID=A0A7J7MLY4_9MAGN|nr:hypothetical protein GIB67_039155 [Kingdonia uniflora]